MALLQGGLQGHPHISPHTYMNLPAPFPQPNPHLSRLADQRRSGHLPDPRTGVIHNIHHILQGQGTTLEPVTNQHTDLSVSTYITYYTII